jgi:ankyrin repeat protein
MAPLDCVIVRVAAALLLLAALSGHPAAAAGNPSGRGGPLFDAVDAGDVAAVKRLLARGAEVNARDGRGETALMRAAVYADAGVVAALLAAGANANARDKAGATALMWAVGDPAKVKLLLRHGADVNARADSGFTPLLIAAQSEGTAATVALLLERGADIRQATKSGFTPLMASFAGGDPEVAALILARGPDVRAATRVGWTALHGAAAAGDAGAVRRLLELGAGANPAKNFQGRTPLIWAAQSGDAAVARPLLDRGADVRAREALNGLTALHLAAGVEGDRADLVEALLGTGADPNAADGDGSTPLAWATRQGNAAVARLLRATGAKEPAAAGVRGERPRAGDGNTAAEAVRRSLPLLQRSGPEFLRNSADGCVSCHNQALPAMAVGLARARGFAVDRGAEREQAAETLNVLAPRRDLFLQGHGVADRLDPAYLLAGLEAAGQAPDPTTHALAHYLTLTQSGDGRWRALQPRHPMEGSDFTATALSLRALRRFAPPGRREEVVRRVERARAWLAAAAPRTTEDRAFQLLGLAWAGARGEVPAKAAAGLRAEQRRDGGWGQLPALDSDAYATGQALAALAEAGGLSPNDPAYRRGAAFLLRTQLRDGSWFVATRSLPVQPYFESGFPHGKSQFISCAATAWAVMALARAAPDGPSSVPGAGLGVEPGTVPAGRGADPG